MDTAVADPSAPVAEAPPSAADAPGAPAPLARSCGVCSAPLALDQNWCLECGTAAPGRLGRRSGWRLAASVVSLTVLIGSGAVAASYAALSSDSNRAASRPTVVAQAPSPTVNPGPPPAGAAPAPLPTLPPATQAPAPGKPVVGLPGAAGRPAGVPSTPVTPTPAPVSPKSATSTPTATAKHHATTTSGARRILLDTDAASVYNPDGLDPSRFGDPAAAIDQDTSTAWTAQLDANGKLGAGLSIDLKSALAVSTLKLLVTSPGMDVEIYGTAGSQPASITAPAWMRLATRPSIRRNATIKLATQGQRLRHILVYIPHGAGGPGSGTVGISELAVLR